MQDGFHYQKFNFTTKYKSGKSNILANALSRKPSLLTIMRAIMISFDATKDSYEEDEDFLNCGSNAKRLVSNHQGSNWKMDFCSKKIDCASQRPHQQHN